MCRFISYLGDPIILYDLLYKPEHSLINQSTHAREMDEPLNGDGFGVSWYMPQIDDFPGVFKSIQPAWNNPNLKELSKKLMSGCFLAHVRSASEGGVNYDNTHPFIFKQYACMHNGFINDIYKIRQQILCERSTHIFRWIKGKTDSELFFAIFFDMLLESEEELNENNCIVVFNKVMKYIFSLYKNHDLEVPLILLNAVISNGKSLFVFRYTSKPDKQANTLYYSFGHHLKYIDGYCHMDTSSNEKKAVLIASEIATTHKSDWKVLPINNILVVKENFDLEVMKL